jgi:membrane associated rhomboid family serine protease
VSTWLDQIKYKYQTGSIVEKLIFINIAIFLLTYLFNTLSFLLKTEDNFIINWFALSAQRNDFTTKPWTIITYGFLHSGFFHILFNLLFLYYIGNIFLDFFSKKQFLVYYFLGIIFGGTLYILSYNYLPALKHEQTILVGASAGVIAILTGIASYIPNYALHFRFIGSIKLIYIAIAFVLLDVIQIPVANAGGHLAHLGGAVIGLILTKYFNQGKNAIVFIENLFLPKKDKPLKTVYKNKTTSKSPTPLEHQKKIDTILDKISKSGYDTLTKEEKDFLFKAGKN